MFNSLLRKATIAIALCFSMNSFAGLIVDTETLDTVTSGITWTHTLNEPGETPFTLGSAESADLYIEFADDNIGTQVCFFFICETFEDGEEWATILVGTIDFQDGALFYEANQDFSQALGINSVAALNTTGTLEISVWGKAFSDFYIGDSILKVTTAEVPEPASLALLGLGLLGLAYSRRNLKA